MKKIFFVFVAVLMLSACGSKEKDAEYYINHPEEMKQKWEECSKMSAAEQAQQANKEAMSQADSKRFFGDKIEKPGEGKGRGTKHF
jgi:uncharacterized protein YcfL